MEINVLIYLLRDAWKKLEGITELKAKHAYVEILLQVAMEVKKKKKKSYKMSILTD